MENPMYWLSQVRDAERIGNLEFADECYDKYWEAVYAMRRSDKELNRRIEQELAKEAAKARGK